MANHRPIKTLYAASRRKAATDATAMSIGRACTPVSALRSAITKMHDRAYVRADVYNDWGVHLYSLLRQEGGIHIQRVHGERL